MMIRSLGVEVVRMQFGVWMGRQDRMKSEGIKAGSACFADGRKGQYYVAKVTSAGRVGVNSGSFMLFSPF